MIVVDDGSATAPEAVVAPFRDRFNVMLLPRPHASRAATRNAGTGEFVAFTDDCLPARKWLTMLAARFATAPSCAIGGRTLNALPDNPYSTASHLLNDYLHAYYNTASSRARFFTSMNLGLPADHFRAIGGFDVTFTTGIGGSRTL